MPSGRIMHYIIIVSSSRRKEYCLEDFLYCSVYLSTFSESLMLNNSSIAIFPCLYIYVRMAYNYKIYG